MLIRQSAVMLGIFCFIDFIITALCIFIVLRIITRVKNQLEYKKLAEEEKAKKEAEEKAKAEKEAADAAAAEAAAKQEIFNKSIMQQEVLLAEIRDLLKEGK